MEEKKERSSENIFFVLKNESHKCVEKKPEWVNLLSFPVAQLVEHGASNAKIMGSIPRESKSW